MQQNNSSIYKEQSVPFSSDTADNIAIVAAVNQMEEKDVEAICIEKIMATIMENYNIYLEEKYPNLVKDIQGIINAMHLSKTVADFMFDSVAEKGKESEYWEIFQEIKSVVKPFTAYK